MRVRQYVRGMSWVGCLALFGCALVVTPMALHAQQPKPQVALIDLSQSPFAKLHPVAISAVSIDSGFWAERRKVNVEKSIPSLLDLLEAQGIIDNFRRVSGRKKVARRGPLYTDSDVYKWVEGAALSLESGPNPDLQARIDAVIDEIVAAQDENGYLNTWFQDERKKDRWQRQYTDHELYCLGHLLQAAIAYQRATGDRKLLDAGIRFVDHIIKDVIPSGQALWAGHPEIEMALVELYRNERDKRYLDLAAYLLKGDGKKLGGTASQFKYSFSGIPFTNRKQMEGHAVRACYASAGATDYYMETGFPGYWRTLTQLWEDMSARKMYVTGGVGSRASGEAFGEPYELPNSLAYTESCAAISNLIWSWRMLQADPDAKYADVMERSLYNGINSGMSLSGTLYCYRNPLQLSGDPDDKIRSPWYATTCCPPNLQRTFAALPGYLYGTSKEGLYVHHFASGRMQTRLWDRTWVQVTQETGFPFQGDLRMTVSPAKPTEFTVHVRIPNWSAKTAVKVNGEVQADVKAGAYLALRRTWKEGDVVEVDFDMTPQLLRANPLAKENTNSVVVQRGPIVYAMEQVDQPFGVKVEDAALSLSSNPGQDFRAVHLPDLLGGVTVLKHQGVVFETAGSALPLYAPLQSYPERKTKPAELTFIPYYAFHNRGEVAMQVWVPYVAR